jgi:membrane associated rhomboid family serine protease
LAALRHAAEQPIACVPLSGAFVTRTSEPFFNVPGVVLAILAICALVLAGQTYLLTDEENVAFRYCFGFVPARYDGSSMPAWMCPRGTGAEIWSFVTHAFIHGNITHLAINSILFLIVGSAVARRFGSLRVVGFFAATAAGGALMHLATNWGEAVPAIGASAVVFGFTAGAIRFVFQPGGPLATIGKDDPSAYLVPAAPLSSALRNFRAVVLVVAWLALTVLDAVFDAPDGAMRVSWEAHIGGFLTGLLLFPLFDPAPSRAA